jgi:transposase InsO family protein
MNPPWTQSVTAQPETSAAQETVAALREAPAGPPRASGREVSRASREQGKRLYQFTAIDDCTRIRVLKVFDACNQRTAIQFINDVRRRLPFRILTVQTDNGAEFQTQFHGHLHDLDIRHVYIRPRSPHLNGKVERSHRVDDQEFYQLLDADGIRNDIYLFNDKLKEWEDYYNYHRPHGALGGQPRTSGSSPKPNAAASPKS